MFIPLLRRLIVAWMAVAHGSGRKLAPRRGAAVELHLLQHLGPHHGLVQLLLLEVKVKGACAPRKSCFCQGYQVPASQGSMRYNLTENSR